MIDGAKLRVVCGAPATPALLSATFLPSRPCGAKLRRLGFTVAGGSAVVIVTCPICDAGEVRR